jgi:dTDP-4-dehydrorhamnose reductase
VNFGRPALLSFKGMSKRVVIVGRGGQLGTELVKVFSRRGYEVTGLTRQEVDVTDSARVEQIMADLDPSMIFNAAAYNKVDVAEKEPQLAYQGNALAVRNLALAARQVDAKLITFSTDYVFDGMAGRPYTEDDDPRPLGAYAVSKLAGELYAQAYLDAPLIIRTSGVFGPAGLKTAGGNFVETMLRLASSGNPIRVVEDHVASPTYAPDLAERSADLVEKDATGIFHIGGGLPISWFAYAALIFKAAGLAPELRPTNEREYRTMARRPRFSALSNGKMERLGVAPMPTLEEALAGYMKERG